MVETRDSSDERFSGVSGASGTGLTVDHHVIGGSIADFLVTL
jgi:hypothetical protein